MNEKAIKVLEYNKIIELLMLQAGSEMTRKVISELKPFKERRIIEEALAETDEASQLILYKGALPLGNFYDIKESLIFAKKGGNLSIKQLIKILYNMKVTINIIAYIRGDLPPLPIIKSLVEVLMAFNNIASDIDSAIESEETLSDNASHELKNIRRDILRQNESIKNKINQMVNKSDNKDMLQDAIVTVRDGRYVIPVKQEHRGKFPGVIHDQSSSGATLFIEPQIIVNLNNELKEMEASEKAEVERILAEFSMKIGEIADQLANNQEILVHLDLIMAKGKLANLQKSECPSISEENIMQLKKARHPLIENDKVVPIDIEIGGKYKTLVVTGPNTGGKTVTLKTAGLLAMMAQTGLHIPASGGSKIKVYKDIFADIGDEQSIEQSLSTFSSHMKNIISIVDRGEKDTLVLLDELGAGTDPTEGAALAISILNTLRDKGVDVIATTHYTELKKYALKTEEVENASMEFDIETLSPTYKLIIGIPGKSNAFEIAKKLGLDGKIIDRAIELLEGGDIQFEEVLQAIEKDKKLAEEERDEAILLNIEMKKLKEEVEKENKRLERERTNLLNKAKEEAREILSEARDLSKSVQIELRELSKLESMGEKNKKLDRTKRKIKDAAGRYKETIVVEKNDNPLDIKDVAIGLRVKVISLGQNGEIVGTPDSRGEITVQVGMMKVKCKPEDLKLIIDGTEKKKAKSKKNTYSSLYKSKTTNISTSINVRGENLDDALAMVEKYLDDAYIAKLESVTIIHGRGEGILKEGIHNMLKGYKNVSSYEKGKYNDGGDGVTIVKFK